MAGLIAASMSHAQQAGISEPVAALCPPDPLAVLITPDAASTAFDEPIDLSADFAESNPDAANFRGAVVVEQGGRRLEAAEVILDRVNNRIHAEGEVSYGDHRLAIRSMGADIDLNNRSGYFDDARYYVPERNAQGDADRVAVDYPARRSRLDKVTYSTCIRDDEFWELRTGELNLDQNSGRGSARDIVLAIKDVPVFYFPYLSFPINDERQSGFLFAEGGYDEDGGLDIRFPYYWNIAPNMDATISPRIITNRGVQLGTEFRFLQPKQSGEIEFEYLPSDQEFGDDREALFVRHNSNFVDNLFTELLFQYVSDDDYLDDLENYLDLLSPTVLERRFDTVYRGGPWTALLRVQDFQTVDDEIFDPGEEPYTRLPQLRFDGDWPQSLYGLNYELRSEAVYFDHDTKTDAVRVDLWPGVSLPYRWPGAYVMPRLSYRLTAYDIDDPVTSQADTRITRDTPVFSVDSGLFFEREVDWDWFGGSAVQTLEPRLFYLYVPFEEQSDIPLFDTTELDPSFLSLFQENRFTGADRMGDANQLTVAMSTRLLERESGAERLRLGLGQIQYFRDRRVTLNNTDPIEDNNSDLLGEFVFQVSPRLSLRGTAQWDPDGNETQRSALDIRYRHDGGRIINASYRFARDNEDSELNSLEQVEMAFAWPLGDQWHGVGRWNYSLATKRNLDLFAGFEYDECCWALRMVARHHRDSPTDEDASNSVLVQLELKGLAGIGQGLQSFLRNTIIGYEPDRYR